MNLQEVNSNIQNSSAAQLIGSDQNPTQDQTYKVTSNEAHTGADLQADGKVISAPGHVDDQDHTFSSIILPLCRPSHGIFFLLSWKICKYNCVFSCKSAPFAYFCFTSDLVTLLEDEKL